MIRAYSYDDVLIVPSYSDLKSRSDVDISTFLSGIELKVPIISSPMDTVTDIRMQQAMSLVGGYGVHHRYCSTDELDRAKWFGGIAVSPSMGVDTIRRMVDTFDGNRLVCFLDVAHGDNKVCLDYAQEISKYATVVSGNICTLAAAKRYNNIGIHRLRVGVGGGHACSTRVIAGVGVPTFSAIKDIYDNTDGNYIIADGGIRSSGDIVKALAVGASAVMLGMLLTGATEAPGRRENGMKEFRGMASAEALDDAGKERNVEGISTWVLEDGPVSEIINELARGIRAGFAYVGARNITELRRNARFVEVSHNGYVEGLPKNV